MTEAGFLETLERVEAVHSILKRMEDIDCVLDKITDCVLDKITIIEEFINRFGTLEALIARFEEVEQQLYILKEIFNVEEAAKYLNISTGHLYRLTSTHEIPFSKPNGKHIFFERKALDDWKRRNPVLSNREIERQAALAGMNMDARNQQMKKGKKL